MEARLFIGVVGVAAGFACLFAATFVAAADLRRRRAAMAAQGDRFNVSGLIAWRVRNGFASLVPLAQKLLEVQRVRTFADELVVYFTHRGWTTAAESVLTVVIAGLAVIAAVVGAVARNVFGPIACCICAVAVLHAVVGNERDKRNEAVRDSIPDALESMGACFGSGFTLLQTFSQVSREVPGPLGSTFSRCAHVLETGGSAEEALVALREGTYAEELAFVAVALDVQHQSGGAMRQVLAAAADAVKGTLALRRALRVQTAQARLSARVVAVMPFVLVAAFSLVSPDFLSPFFSSVLGYALLALALVMQAAGILLVHRALEVEGVS